MEHRQFLSKAELAQLDQLRDRRETHRAELRDTTRAIRRLELRGYQRRHQDRGDAA